MRNADPGNWLDPGLHLENVESELGIDILVFRRNRPDLKITQIGHLDFSSCKHR